jgi:2-hydroxychromene-2-carboxylate isomerase
MTKTAARPTVEFFFDFMSPTSYLAHTQLPRIADRVGAEIIWRPMLTLQLHELTENRSPTAVPNKARWIFQDLLRFAGRYGVPLVINPNLPFEMRDALHGALVALERGEIERYCAALFPAVWVEKIDVDDRGALADRIVEAGLDAQAILARIDQPKIAAALNANTREAAERGAFGAPTFFVGDEMHFGQDRLDFVEAALTRGD